MTTSTALTFFTAIFLALRGALAEELYVVMYVCVSAIKARWGLFGHVVGMAHDTPAQMAIDEYITPTATAGWQGRPHTTLPTTIDNDLQGVGKRLRNKQDLQHFSLLCKR